MLSQTAYAAILKTFQAFFDRADVRPGCVISLQTFGAYGANFNPHAHALVSDGVFTPDGEFLPLPAPDTAAVMEVFRRLFLERLHRAERLSETFMHHLLSWAHPGFSVFAGPAVDGAALASLESQSRYITRPALAMDALEEVDEGTLSLETPPDPRTGATRVALDPLEWIQRITADTWITFLDQFLPGALTFLYMPDEPGPSEYGRIWTIANNIHSNPGPGQRLPIFVTHSYTAALDGAIDIWCSPPRGFDLQRVAQERARGRRYWIYNGGRPHAPAIVIDSPATDPRAMIWACFKHGIDVYFYWHSVHWRHNHQMRPGGDRNQNIWANPVTFDNGQSMANGDGVLIYPGEEKLHPEEDRGIPGPCSTIQLANFRRGLQDHQYLTLARKIGLESEVQQALQAVAPRMFSEATAEVGFAETGNAFEAVRYALGKAISGTRTSAGRR